MDNAGDVDGIRVSFPNETVFASLLSCKRTLGHLTQLQIQLFEANDPINPIRNGVQLNGITTILMGSLMPNVDYLVKVTNPNLVPTIYNLRFNLSGTSNTVA